jgi:hypothetical protein
MAEGEVFQKVGIVKRFCETRFAGWDFRTRMFDGVLLRACTTVRGGPIAQLCDICDADSW